MLLACAAADGVRAQGDVSPWVGEPLPVEGGEFYLYNKAGGGFLLGANTWGTQASLGQPGLLCTLEAMPDGKYAIKTMSDKYLKDDYIDKDKNGYDFTDLNPEDDVYEFSLFGNGRYLYYAGSGTVLSRTEEPDNYQWILVSKEQRIRALEGHGRGGGRRDLLCHGGEFRPVTTERLAGKPYRRHIDAHRA